jgi:galactitol-specific phosphotransferase system IIB component
MDELIRELVAAADDMEGDIDTEDLLYQAANVLRVYKKALLAAYAALDNGADREDVKDDIRAILEDGSANLSRPG